MNYDENGHATDKQISKLATYVYCLRLLFVTSLTLWKLTELWKITFFNGHINYKWPFSIAMLGYVSLPEGTSVPWWSCGSPARESNGQARSNTLTYKMLEHVSLAVPVQLRGTRYMRHVCMYIYIYYIYFYILYLFCLFIYSFVCLFIDLSHL